MDEYKLDEETRAAVLVILKKFYEENPADGVVRGAAHLTVAGLRKNIISFIEDEYTIPDLLWWRPHFQDAKLPADDLVNSLSLIFPE